MATDNATNLKSHPKKMLTVKQNASWVHVNLTKSHEITIILFTCLIIIISIALSPLQTILNTQSNLYIPTKEILFQNGSFLVRKVERVDNIKVEDFEKYYAPEYLAVPLVIENSQAGEYNEKEWTREALKKKCGHMDILLEKNCSIEDVKNGGPICHSVRLVNTSLIGKEWAGLEFIDVGLFNISTMGDFFNVQDNLYPDTQLYLHDAPLYRYCPSAINDFKAPKYFPFDYRQLGNFYGEDRLKSIWHPGIFVGKKGSGSPLHVDSDWSRFWMFQLSGKKLWRLFPPSEYNKLYPTDPEWLNINNRNVLNPFKFLVDAFNPDFVKFPKANGALVYETILNPGDLLFIPEGWAHQVLNLEDIVASSLNFVDYHNLAKYLSQDKSDQIDGDKDLTELNLLEREMLTSVFVPLAHPSYNDEASSNNTDEEIKRFGNINWLDFYRNHDFTLIDFIPPGVVRFVEQNKGNLDQPMDEYGRSILHLAVKFHFLGAAAYLIENGASIFSKDFANDTPLAYAERQNDKDMVDLLYTWTNQEGSEQDPDIL